MRTLLLLVIAACGNVNTSAPQPDALADAAPADAMNPCPLKIMNPAPPSWLMQGSFEPALDPAGSHAQVWRSSGRIPSPAAFSVTFMAGDRITGLVFDAFGNGSNAGLQTIEVIYSPDLNGPGYQILGRGDDLGRKAQWGQVGFTDFQPAVLSSSSALWVRFDVSEVGYYLGMVTPTFERPCPSGKN
jgi:hypothetical protein